MLWNPDERLIEKPEIVPPFQMGDGTKSDPRSVARKMNDELPPRAALYLSSLLPV